MIKLVFWKMARHCSGATRKQMRVSCQERGGKEEDSMEGRGIRLPLVEPLLRVPLAVIVDVVSNRSEVRDVRGCCS